ncbi:MAG: hypothetical protein IT179_04595 [Acidobacteria bacterium]|nr:hypothetical protein [Acidobacteriota bacterium]
MTFRDRLLATIAAARPVLEAPGVLIVGSEVPNLLQPEVAATLVVSQDLDIGVPIAHHAEVASRLVDLRQFAPSAEEPSVWVPHMPDLLELNFVGMDAAQDPAEAYVLADPHLPLLVFGALSLVVPGKTLDIGGSRVRLPRAGGLLLEKLVTDRTGDKGERDLLVALGLLQVASDDDLSELVAGYRALRPELQYAVRSNLTQLSLLAPHEGMPDPRTGRTLVHALLRTLERGEPS